MHNLKPEETERQSRAARSFRGKGCGSQGRARGAGRGLQLPRLHPAGAARGPRLVAADNPQPALRSCRLRRGEGASVKAETP